MSGYEIAGFLMAALQVSLFWVVLAMAGFLRSMWGL